MLVFLSGCDFASSVFRNEALCDHYTLVVSSDAELLYCDNCGTNFNHYTNDTINEVLRKCRTIIVDCSNSEAIVNDSFSRFSSAKEIILTEGITKIANFAFQNFHSLTTIRFPSTIIEITEKAFYNCTALKTITIPNSVTRLFAGPFQNCTSLQSVEIPASMIQLSAAIRPSSNPFIPDEEIGVFQGCTSLHEVTFAEDCFLESIESWTFRGCSFLSNIVLPKSLSYIGSMVFDGCSYLRTLRYEGSKEEWDAITKDQDWAEGSSLNEIVCLNGTPDIEADDVWIRL